jgi:CheY-like chemotaxis protein
MVGSKILQDKRIYIVEDNTDNIYILMTILRAHGAVVTVDWFAKGESHKILQALPIDIILLDLMLPNNYSGYEIFQELHALPQLAAVPIVAVSAADTSIAVPKVRSLGFSGFIKKPIDDELFPQQLKAILENQPVWFFD